MGRVVNANPYTKEKIIGACAITLIIGFIVGLVFMLVLDKEIENYEVAAFKCNNGDILYIVDELCGDELGYNVYPPIKEVFNMAEYKRGLLEIDVVDLKDLITEEEVPNYMKELDSYYIMRDTVFAVESSIDRREQNDGDIFLPSPEK